MLERMTGIRARYEELSSRLSHPETITDRNTWRDMNREHAELGEIVLAADACQEVSDSLESCRQMLSEHLDPEMRELVHAEIDELESRQKTLEEQLKILLIPKDPNDERDVILEIRAGTGGDEASLFGADLMRMYSRYAERNGYRFEILESNMTDMGGVKEAVISIGGKHGAYSRLKFESGVHRVQRIPETESQGRIQTSAATVAVLPEADDVSVEIKDSDLRIDTYRSSGAGGQHVNKTESAIRITHIPTGIVVSCQDEKSQFKNKEQAMRVLKSRIMDYYQSKQDAEISSARKSMVGSGDRSERIRTYNFPQSRVTDHRIGLTLYRLEQIMDGDLDEIIDALILAERTRQLSDGE